MSLFFLLSVITKSKPHSVTVALHLDCLYVVYCILAVQTTLPCNKGSGIGHHFGLVAFIVTIGDNRDKWQLNKFLLLNCVAHSNSVPPFLLNVIL